MIEILVSALSANGAPISEYVPSTSGEGLRSQDFAACMRGLSKVQTDLIFCKYLLDEKSCSDGIRKSYRSYLYRNKEFLNWLFMCDRDDPNVMEVARTIDRRSRHTPILMSLAWDSVISSSRCLKCNGVGKMIIQQEHKCEDCMGKGIIGAAMSAELKSIRMHCSLSRWWSDWNEPFKTYFESPLWVVETEAISLMAEQWG